MRVAQEEIFGPVLAMIEFDDIEQAAEIANRSQYGLVAGIWTRDINKAMSLASRIKSGQVYINTYGAGGGTRDSSTLRRRSRASTRSCGSEVVR